MVSNVANLKNTTHIAILGVVGGYAPISLSNKLDISVDKLGFWIPWNAISINKLDIWISVFWYFERARAFFRAKEGDAKTFINCGWP